MRSKLARLVALIAVLTTLVAPVNAQSTDIRAPAAGFAQAPEAKGPGTEQTEATPIDVTASLELGAPTKARVIGETGGTAAAVYIVQLVGEPLATYTGGVAGLGATSPLATGERKLNLKSSVSAAYRNYLVQHQAQFLTAAERTVGRAVEVLYRYDVAFNGVAVRLTPQEAAQVVALPGVQQIQRDFLRYPLTDAGPAWIGATGIWDGTTTGGLPGTKGEGIIVGIIDTGINHDHPSFADIGGDGYDHTNPFGAGTYIGYCVSTPSFCNDKLIGAWNYADGPEDLEGHGSHTASTVAGNDVLSTTAVISTPTTMISATISGVAPHANIIAYDACQSGACFLSGLVAAINQAVSDTVDVINYSIGGGPSDPWTDSDSQAFLAARNAGVFAAVSAGNDGPGPATIGSPADAPWVMSVGASTHNRAFLNALINMAGDGTPPPDLHGRSITFGYGPAQVVYAGAAPYNNNLCSPFPPNTFTGQIVVCDRGVVGRVQKGINVKNAGGGGMVLVQASAAGGGVGGLVSEPHVLPAVHLMYTDGVTLKTWVATGTVHTATISGTVRAFSPSYGDVMADFSSRGPNPSVPDTIKPDVTAPGVNIFAAYKDPENYNFLVGTSMSSPHTAGAAALIRALHPDWSPAKVQSALMATALAVGPRKEDGVTPADPFDIGAGHVDLRQAGQAGFVLNETGANYTAANPATGGDPSRLNHASLAQDACLVICSWTRVISSTRATPITWTVSITAPAGLTVTVTPSVFSLGAFASRTITVTANPASTPVDVWAFAQVNFTPDTATVPSAHFPMAIKPRAGNVPGEIDINTRRSAGSHLVEDLQSIEITDLTVREYGLVRATVMQPLLSQDPTRGNAYDNLNDGTTFYFTLTVPSGAKRFVAEITESDAVDMDLFVGRDLDGDGPEATEELGASTSPVALEYVNLPNPAAGAYWVLVQNWDESNTPPDYAIVAAAAVPGTDSGNMTVTGPMTVTALSPFDLRVFWDTPTMVAGDHWYSTFDMGSDPGSPGNIGVVDVHIARKADDVTKTVSSQTASPGDTLTYTITIQPNVTMADLLYMITDTIPAGLTYVPGSATGGAVVVGNTLTWSGTLPTRRYILKNGDTDPLCTMPRAGDDGDPDDYLNLWAFGIIPDPRVFGDSVWYAVTFSGGPIEFFGQNTGGARVNFTDDGFAFFDPSTPGGTPWVNENMPDADDPNNLMAMFWRDLEIVYATSPISRGVTLAELTSGGVPVAGIIEYDDVQVFGSPSNTYDFEVAVYKAVSDTPGAYEVRFAYDNIVGNLITGTVGVENATGTAGTKFAYNDGALGTLHNGMALCFDWNFPSPQPPINITYQVTVNSTATPAILTNHADHNTDNPGSKVATASVSVGSRMLYLPIIFDN